MKISLFLAFCLIFGLIFASCEDNYYTGASCGISADCGLGYSCFNGQCVYGSPPCYDLDGGQNLDVISSTYSEYLVCTDGCQGLQVEEYYCNGTEIWSNLMDCTWDHFCSGGSCAPSPCVDSDGQDIFTAGYIEFSDGNKILDTCLTDDIVAEAVCDDVSPYKNYYCLSNQVCQYGACINISLAEPIPEPYVVTCGEYKAGEYWDIDDGCNTCTCREDGTTLCTDYPCEELECAINSDCLDNESCSESKCVLVEEGECGYLENHQWNDYGCCKDTDCGENYTCMNNTCEEKEKQQIEDLSIEETWFFVLLLVIIVIVLFLVYKLLF